jgi:hypothetical protein
VLPVQGSPEALRRVEQRSLVIQLERLMTYPMVERQVRAGQLFLHAWYYVIEEGQVLVLEAERGAFVAHAGLGQPIDTAAASAIIDGSERSGADPRVSEIDASHWFRMPERAG